MQDKNEGDGLEENQLKYDGISPAIRRFKHLAAKCCQNATLTGTDTPEIQLSKYISELEQGLSRVQEDQWTQQHFGLIAELAHDLLAAPASQAFVERIFSVCGMLTQGQRNMMSRSLEMRVYLKLNSRVLDEM